MRKLVCVAIIALLSCTCLFAQKTSIKGIVADTTDNKNLQNSVVTLLTVKDSVLVKFARVDRSGNFALSNIDTGQYVLMITHPYLGDFFDKVDVKDSNPVDLGTIVMIPKSKLLAEVIIRSGSPIKIKGDTTVYTADSFKVRPGANVEELLRRLPGIQVDKNGQITAMGEKVKKVLVDGEEFFGSDPGIATKNLRADMVKDVEVFDKKSDQAEFTGIDDGVKDKTINLKLKDDKKHGYFGKVEAGGGLTKDRYNNSVMLNAFKAKRKIAAYGIMSNSGQTNLDWQDAQNYGGGMEGVDMGVSDDGGMYMMWNGDGDDGYYGGRNGIPTNWNGGLHFNNKYNDGKQSVNAGYKFSKTNSPGVTSIFSKNFLPDRSWSTQSRSENFSSIIKHSFNLTIDVNLDSANSLKWTTKANNRNARTRSNFTSSMIDDDGSLINTNDRRTLNESDNNSVTTTLLFKHKFKKLARTLSVNTDLAWNKSSTDGLLFSRINYYVNGNFDRYDSIDQQNLTDNEGKSIATKIAYTEPLMKNMYLEVSYAFSYNNNSNDRITNVKSPADKYETKIDSLSNAFAFNRLVNTPGLNFRITKKKYNFSFGSAVSFSNFIQKNLSEGLKANYNYVNFFPRMNFNYKFKPNEGFRFNYNGASTAPTLEQLQPISVNTDPLNIYIGNPNLDQSFRHSVNMGYNFFNILKERGIWSNVNFSTTQNAFSQYSSIDSGVRTYQTVNVNGVYNLNTFIDYNFKLKGTKWNFGMGPTINANRNVDLIQDPVTLLPVKNVTKTLGYGARVQVSQYVENKYNFSFGPTITWNRSKASVNSTANANYWQVECWSDATVQLPKKFELNTNAQIQLRQKDPRFPANSNYTNWNAELKKRFFKGNDLELKAGIYDILNQNKGYQRNFNSYSFTETYYNTLRRFWMVTLTWNISKNGKPTSGF